MNDDGHERGGPVTVHLDLAGLATDYYYLTSVHGDVPSGTLDFGGQLLGYGVHDKESSKCAVWLHGRNAANEYTDTITYGNTPTPFTSYELRYWEGVFTGTPYTYYTRTNWVEASVRLSPGNHGARDGIPTDGNDGLKFGHSDVSRHELSHALRHKWDGDLIHWNWDDTKFIYGQYHDYTGSTINSEGFAFNEGWAEYWDGELYWDLAQHGRHPDIEGYVASELELIAEQCKLLRGKVETDPALQRWFMADVLRRHPGRIHSLGDFLNGIAADYGPCSLSPSATPLVIGPPTNDPGQTEIYGATYQDHVQSVQAHLDQLSDKIDQLSSQLDQARRKALSPPICLPSDCYDAAHTLVEPAMIDLTKQQTELVKTRLAYWLDKGAYEKWQHLSNDPLFIETDHQAYIHAVLLLDLAAVTKAWTALQLVAPISSDAARFGQKFADMQKQINQLLLTGDDPPSNFMPPVSILDDNQVVAIDPATIGEFPAGASLGPNRPLPGRPLPDDGGLPDGGIGSIDDGGLSGGGGSLTHGPDVPPTDKEEGGCSVSPLGGHGSSSSGLYCSLMMFGMLGWRRGRRMARGLLGVLAGCALLAGSGCGHPDSGTKADGGSMDLMGADAQLAHFCDDDPLLEGTCADRFFADVVTCFHPQDTCTQTDEGTSYVTNWPGGATLTWMGSDDAPEASWTQGDTTCMSGTLMGTGDFPQYALHRNGQDVAYDANTGAFTCPDGSQITISPFYGACAELIQLLLPNCDQGGTTGP